MCQKWPKKPEKATGIQYSPEKMTKSSKLNMRGPYLLKYAEKMQTLHPYKVFLAAESIFEVKFHLSPQ
jgi:hypothetical protein